MCFERLYFTYHEIFNLNLIDCFIMQVQDRSIEHLQSKYKELKKNARQVIANMKRDVAQTGNKNLKPTTVKAINNETLLLLRKQMGPSAAGFKSKNCESFDQNNRNLLCKKHKKVKLKSHHFEFKFRL